MLVGQQTLVERFDRDRLAFGPGAPFRVVEAIEPDDIVSSAAHVLSLLARRLIASGLSVKLVSA